MILPAVLASGSALLGGSIALVAQRRPSVLERTRTFAFAAAAGVVAFHLLPEILPEQGLLALLWIAAGFALPWVLETAARTLGPGLLKGRGLSTQRVAAEVGFAALVFHSVAEGLALVAALAQPRSNLDLEVALVAHHAPLTAAVVLPFLDLGGARAVAFRAALIGAAGLAGVLGSVLLPGLSQASFLSAATAVTAGALLHVVADEIRTQRFGSPLERALDIAACFAGLLVAGLGAMLHLRDESAEPVLEFLRSVSGIALAAGPAVLCGSVVSALLAARTRFFRWDAFLLALVLLGPAAAAAWSVLTVVLALPFARDLASTASSRPVLAELAALVRARAPPLFLLLIAAASLEVSASVFPRSPPAAAALLLVVALAARLDEAGATLIAAVLVHKGLDPGLAVGLLAVGPILRVAARRRLLARGRVVASAIFVGECVLAIAAGKALSATGALASAQAVVTAALRNLGESLPDQAASSPVGAAAAVVVVAAALSTLWSEGVRGWFTPLRHGPRAV